MKPKRLNSKILFLINGLGLGNSTRCHAIIQELLKRNTEVRIVTSENGEWYFNQNLPQVKTYISKNLNYGSHLGKISALHTVFEFPNNFRAFLKNSRQLFKILDDWAPDVVVTDSIYTTYEIKKRKIPIIAINNADMVLSGCSKFKDYPKSVLLQLYFVEFIDYLFHKYVPSIVISPHIQLGFAKKHPKIKQVGHLVRDGIKSRKKTTTKVLSVVVMLSGSRFGSPVSFSKEDFSYSIDVIGRDRPKNSLSEKIFYHGKVPDTVPILNKADLLVVNGGYSAVSEALHMKKPMIVIPVPGHAEQWVNARIVQDCGVGLMGSEATLEQDLKLAVKKFNQLSKNYKLLKNSNNGTREAAEKILDFCL